MRLSYGGPAVSVPELAAALAHTGVDIGLWASDGSKPRDVLGDYSERITVLKGTLESALEAYPDVDVIHDNGIWLPHNHALAEIAHKRGIPRIVTTRGMLQPWALKHKGIKKRVAWMLYQKRDLNRARFLHATSDEECASLTRLDLGSDIVTIPNGVDIPDLTSCEAIESCVPKQESCKRQALFLSRLHPMKGLPLLIDAWAQVRPPEWRLAIAGPDEGGHRGEIEWKIREHGLGDVVTFLGPLGRHEKLEAFRRSELFVLPSHAESFGMVIAEALASGVPVLTTVHTPWKSIETAGCGWVTDVTEESLAEALRVATVLDRETLASMGKRGRFLVAENFSWPSVASRMCAVYRKIVESAVPPLTLQSPT